MQCGLWRSPLELSQLFSQPATPMYPFRHRGKLYWLQSLVEEGGRVGLICEHECMTPPGFNIRTTVHEYGGKCFCVFGDKIIFNNLNDGRIYSQHLLADATPIVITAIPPPGHCMSFADLHPAVQHNMVFAVMESSECDGVKRDSLVAIDLSRLSDPGNLVEPVTISKGADFYACPVLSADETRIAWVEWNDPFMPWDQSRLVEAELRGEMMSIEAHRCQVLVDRENCAVCQPGFLADNSLLFVSDSENNNFWNFFRHTKGTIEQITDDQYEYGEAHWVFGKSRWQAISKEKIIAVSSNHEGDCIHEITLASGKNTPLFERVAMCADLWVSTIEQSSNVREDELLWIAGYAEREAEICALNRITADRRTMYAPAINIPHGVSAPKAITYSTRDGRQAYAYFYSPYNRRYRTVPEAKPPLLVTVHGGPTSRATPELHPIKQFFTSLGYAVLDINHRGSTGYGRAYRQSLLGQWGEGDVTDIVDGIRYVIAQNWADADLIFIRGGSAGGYAVLRALTLFPEIFAGGACYYGIGNLITLAKMTHRFEGCYTDRLVGEVFNPATASQPASRFVKRSPSFQLDRLECPLILFQGLDDKVVPPTVSREVVELLSQKGIPHEYVEYENEGHGFRQLPTRIDSLQRETNFFATIIQTKIDVRVL